MVVWSEMYTSDQVYPQLENCEFQTMLLLDLNSQSGFGLHTVTYMCTAQAECANHETREYGAKSSHLGRLLLIGTPMHAFSHDYHMHIDTCNTKPSTEFALEDDKGSKS